MCGIAGILGSYKKEQLHTMLNTIIHRGPDATDTYFDNQIALGHNRLSIIDLSPAANQPFISNDGRFILVFNGEIYNYLELKTLLKEAYNFKTDSDSEVLLAAYTVWGKDCLEKLKGMFAFAVWDVHTKTLFVARDRFGVKPFYYHQSSSTFYFASEIKALFAAGIAKNYHEKVWANYFIHGSYGDINETFWNEIYQLPAGHYLLKSDQKISIKKWYFFENRVENYLHNDLSSQEAMDRYSILLRESINLRFRSDVPIGFNVSGGLDSSTLLAYVNQQENSSNIQAYTFYTGDERYDELPWVQQMLSITDNPLKEVLFSAEEVKYYHEKISYHQDEPYGGIPTLAYTKIFEQARKDGFVVLLDGQGMDEQWAGYDYYIKKSESLIQGVSKSPFKKNTLSQDFLDLSKKPTYPELFDDEILNLQYRDLFHTKIPRALRFNDRVSMAFSTELREPFLDHDLVEFAFSLPQDYKISKGVQKYLLRKIVSKLLPAKITYAPKRPIQTPQREWIGNELKSEIDNGIERIYSSKYTHWFDLDQVQSEWKKYLEGDNDSSFHIWQWYNFSQLID